MRTNVPIELTLCAALTLVACDSTTGPESLPPGVAMVPVLIVVPGTASIDGGQSVKLRAMLSGADPLTETPSPVSWFSSDTNLATVRADGSVEGHKAGRVQVVATYQAAQGSALVTVRHPVSQKPLNPRASSRRTTLRWESGGSRCAEG
jgi:hypothetical protein